MDSSAPDNKLRLTFRDSILRKQVFENHQDQSPSCTAVLDASVEADDVFSQQTNDSQLNKSEELFPFSPIPFRKDVPSTLLPLLDTPDSKWTSSILTSFHIQSNNPSPEPESEDNFVRSIYIDSRIGNNTRHGSNLNNTKCDESSSSNESSFINESQLKNYDEKNQICPLSPVAACSRKRKKLFLDINKELFPFSETDHRCSREQSPALDCGTMSDVTINALEQICQESETLYSKDHSSDETGMKICYPDKIESDFQLNSSFYSGEGSIGRTKIRRSFLYPIDAVKKPKPENPIKVNDIFQTVLSLESRSIPAKVPARNEKLPSGLISFSELNSYYEERCKFLLPTHSLSRRSKNEVHKQNPNISISKTSYHINEILSDEREILSALKYYFDHRRINFAQILFEKRPKSAYRKFFASCTKFIRSNFVISNASVNLVNVFCNFFLHNSHLIYNFNLSHHSCRTIFSTRATLYKNDGVSNKGFKDSDFETESDENLAGLDRRSKMFHSSVRKLVGISTQIRKNRCFSAVNHTRFTRHAETTSNNRNSVTFSCVAAKDRQISVDKDSKTRANICTNSMNRERLRTCCDTIKSTTIHFKINNNSNDQLCAKLHELHNTDTLCALDMNPLDRSINVSTTQNAFVKNCDELMTEMPAKFSIAGRQSIRVDRSSIDRAKILLENVTNMPIDMIEEDCREKSNDVSKFSSPSVVEKSFKNVPKSNCTEKTEDVCRSVPTSETTFSDDDLDCAELISFCNLSEKIISSRKFSGFSAVKKLALDKTAKVTYQFSQRNLMLPDHLSTDSSKKNENSTSGSVENNFENLLPVQHVIDSRNSKIQEIPLITKSSVPECTFSTAGGKVLNVKQKSLLRAQKMFLDEIENRNTTLNTVVDKPAGKKRLHINHDTKESIVTNQLNAVKISSSLYDCGYMGFSTANGRKLDVKSESLVKARKLLDSVDCDFDSGNVQNLNRELSNNELLENEIFADVKGENLFCQTANDGAAKFVPIKKFGDLAFSDQNVNSRKKAGNPLIQFPSFNTAAGLKINVSRNSLENAKTLYESTSREPMTTTNEKSNGLACDVHLPFASFSTASGREMSVTDKSLRNARKSYESVSDEIDVTDVKQMSTHWFPSFSSASGKKIDVNGKSLLRATKIYESVSEEQNSDLSKFDNIQSEYPQSAPVFCTANGKKLSVTEKSLQNAKKLYESTVSAETLNQKTKLADRDEKSHSPFAHFTSVSGKMISVTEKSLKLAKTLFESTSDELLASSPPSDMICSDSLLSFTSFSTSAGKKVSVTETSLKKAKELYEIVSNEPLVDSVKSKKCDDDLPLCGASFSRATKNKFDGIRKLYESTAEEKIELTNYASGVTLSAVGSASVENLISTKAPIQNMKKHLVNHTSANRNSRMQPPASFTSAAGKKINVTETSLQTATKLYESISRETSSSAVQWIDEPDLNLPQSLAAFTSVSVAEVHAKDNALPDAMNVCEFASDEFFSSEIESDTIDQEARTTDELKMTSKTQTFPSTSDEPPATRAFFKSKNSSSSREFAASHSAIDLKRSRNDHSLDEWFDVEIAASKRLKIDDTCSKIDRIVRRNATDAQSSRGADAETIPSSYQNCELSSVVNVTEENRKFSLPSSVDLPASPYDRVTSICPKFSPDENSFHKRKLSPKEINFDCTLSPETKLAFTNIESSANKECNSSNLLNLSDEFELSDEIISCLEEFDSRHAKNETDSKTVLNLSQEISESASAFLFDMKNDDASFIPIQSPLCVNSADNEKEDKTPPVESSKSTSPVFDMSKRSRQRRNKKRRSQHSLTLNPLDITYVRKECENGLTSKPTSPEDVLKAFNENFAQKASKRREPAFNLGYPSSKKTKLLVAKINTAEHRAQALVEQQKLINEKDKELCKPRVGSILAEKLSARRKSLREAVNYERPRLWSVEKLLQLGLKRSVINVNAENAQDFVFTADFLRADSNSTYGDSCCVIPNGQGEVCFDNLATAFLSSPGVDPRLVSLSWIRNHYRWIVWKLASTEKSFPTVFGGKYLTLDKVLAQLKFRYDWEVDRCHRSALKRILECDSSAAEPVVLCVATIKTIAASSGEYEMELTDGWYCVPCLFDAEMLKLLTQKKVSVGTKLLITNAELTGAGEGYDPLQANTGARLKIATNSVRRTRWYTPLGLYAGKPLRISDLRTILPNGGVIPQFSAVVARVYPLLYLEKKQDGSCVFYNEKVHFKKMADFERRRQICLENLLSQVASEVQDENPLLDSDDCRSSEFDSDLITCQNHRLKEQDRIRMLIEERVNQKLPDEFKAQKPAMCMLKMRLIKDDPSGYPLPATMLTVWYPPEDLLSLLSESKAYEFHKVVASGYRNGEVQLSANRLSKYKYLSVSELSRHRRHVTPFSELNINFTAVFGELDIVGMVINLEEFSCGYKKDDSQTIYLTDLEQNFLAIKFRTNVKHIGFEDTFRPKNIVAGLNLQWKRGSFNGKVPTVFASDLSTFVCKSRCDHLQSCIAEFDQFFRNQVSDKFTIECNKKLASILVASGPAATSTPLRPDKKSAPRNHTLETSALRRNEISKSNDSVDSVDNSWNLNSKSVHSRIEKLRSYGEPPPLSPISMSTRPKRSRLQIQTRVCKSGNSKS